MDKIEHGPEYVRPRILLDDRLFPLFVDGAATLLSLSARLPTYQEFIERSGACAPPASRCWQRSRGTYQHAAEAVVNRQQHPQSDSIRSTGQVRSWELNIYRCARPPPEYARRLHRLEYILVWETGSTGLRL